MEIIIKLVLDGNSEIVAHVGSDIGYLICLRHLIRSRAVTNQFFFSEKTYFPLCVRNINSELPSNKSTMDKQNLFLSYHLIQVP